MSKTKSKPKSPKGPMCGYQKSVTDKILKTIEKHQDELCETKNLPQLAKLGYMFNTLYYSGRWFNKCDNSPKYEIEDRIKYNNDKNRDLVYDAWGMHVRNNDNNPTTFDQFSDMIRNGKELTPNEKLSRKKNKTFDEWEEIFLDENYRYKSLFPNRQSVADYLLCTIGTGYKYNHETGCIIEKASGGGKDIDIYGIWENAEFPDHINQVVEEILNNPQSKMAIDQSHREITDINEQKKMEDQETIKLNKMAFSLLLTEINKYLTQENRPNVTIDIPYDDKKAILREFTSRYRKDEEKVKKYEYYPIGTYANILDLDEKSHPSYIKAALEISHDIVNDPPVIKKDWNKFQIDQRNSSIKFCENFIKKFG
jgi:hypothetical protein